MFEQLQAVLLDELGEAGRIDLERVSAFDIQQAKQQSERFVIPTAYDTWPALPSPRVGDTEPVLQVVEAFLATIQPTAAQAAFVAQNR